MYASVHVYTFKLFFFIIAINLANCTEGNIRLYGNTQPREGILHVCRGGVWSTVCHQYWHIQDTNVACYELGYTAYGKLHCNLNFKCT